MIPSVVAAEVAGALRDFLATGFGPSNAALAGVVDDFLAEPDNLAKGPYLSVALPFQQAPEGGEPFPDVPLGFTPYRHQRTAFSRLAAGDGRSTVVATGTGSGKTECFLYPILDHCRARTGTPGVKAIVVYPMNALAADQARRIAAIVDRTPALRGRVTAGLFVGRDNQPQRSAHRTMGRDHVVTDRDTLRERPPDVLLTNYKMLDYLLVRPFDFRLWRHNGPDTLRYLVVDELHTFDGAQGTDLACLIRRLRVRLGASRDGLICAGTSATLGDGDDEAELLAYVSRIFNQPFEPGAVVGEVRQSIDAFLGDAVISRHLHPADDLRGRVDPTRHGTAEAYVRAQHELFFRVPIEGDFASNGWRSRKLRLNYRTTEETRRWAARLLAGRPIDDLDGGSDDDRGITSLTRGPEPLVRCFETRGEQSAFIVDYLKGVQAEEASLRGVCIVARTRRERDAVAAALGEHDLPHVALEAGAVDSAEGEGVRLATMHRVKGLEFDRVVMASINADLVPLPAAIDARGDAVERNSAETEERALVYVAATRAKKDVLSFDAPSRLL